MINNNLEQQAKALYKDWFFDFSPFSSDGNLPNGWHFGTVGDIIQITTLSVFLFRVLKETKWQRYILIMELHHLWIMLTTICSTAFIFYLAKMAQSWIV